MDFGDGDMAMLPDAEPFPAPGSGNRPQRAVDPNHIYSDQPSSESAEAPQKRRKPKARKTLAPDQATELRNNDLLTWHREYVDNQTASRLLKLDKKAKAQSKKNAFSFVWGAGLNDVGNGVGSSKMASPLDMFSGAALLAKIIGQPVPTPEVRLPKYTYYCSCAMNSGTISHRQCPDLHLNLTLPKQC
jgi:hypothetical protein